jgi:hypothetical protein
MQKRYHLIGQQFKQFPIHFILLTVQFILFGYIQNTDIFLLQQVLAIGAGFVLAELIVYWVLQQLINRQKVAILLLIVTIVFFLYGHLYEFISVNLPSLSVLVLPVCIIIVSLLFVITLRAKQDLGKVNQQLNILVFVTVLVSFIQLLPRIFNAYTQQQLVQQEYNPLLLDTYSPALTPESLPDIYYLILDGYPSNSYLEQEMGIDNSDFTGQLEERGFFVAYDSLANYTYTLASIASALNLDFLHNLMPLNRDLSSFILNSYIPENRVARSLQSLGYQYINISAGTGFIPFSTVADMNITFAADGKTIYIDNSSFENRLTILDKRNFLQYLRQTTLLRVLDPTLAQTTNNLATMSSDAPERFILSLQELRSVAENSAPTFTYYHIVKPHLPVNLDRSGNPFYWFDHGYGEDRQAYLANEEIHFADQLFYINQEIVETLDHIFATSEQPPIIIIQGDHGTQLTRNRIEDPNNPILILNAYYFPDGDYAALSNDISPINSFRVILNQFFGASYTMLDDTIRFYQPADKARRLYFEPIPVGETEPPFGITNP